MRTPPFVGSGFGPGSLISTTDGDLPIEWLAQGDRVLTRDRGAQPLRWIGRYRRAECPGAEDWAIELPPEALGIDAPNHALRLYPGHKLLMRGSIVEYLFGHREVLAPAAAVAMEEAKITPIADEWVFQLLFDHHEVILANGLWCESLYCDDIKDPLAPQKVHATVARPSINPADAHLLRSSTVRRAFLRPAA